MRTAVIIFHKNIYSIYKPEWVKKCLDSIRNQTYQNFKVLELCYGPNREQLWPGSEYSHIEMPNHIFALNHLLDKAVLDDYDVIFHTNLDDYFAPQRFQLQLESVKAGYDLVSNDFEHIEEINGMDVHVRDMLFSRTDIKKELNNRHNVLAHPSICMTKDFWLKYRYYDVEALGKEDMLLWQRAVNDGCKIHIIPQKLLSYRLSPNQVGRIYKADRETNL